MDAEVDRELDAVLQWAQGVRRAMEHDPERQDELQAAGHAYVGGVLTTLLHLGLVTEEEHTVWWRRLVDVLGDPPGGWIEG